MSHLSPADRNYLDRRSLRPSFCVPLACHGCYDRSRHSPLFGGLFCKGIGRENSIQIEQTRQACHNGFFAKGPISATRVRLLIQRNLRLVTIGHIIDIFPRCGGGLVPPDLGAVAPCSFWCHPSYSPAH